MVPNSDRRTRRWLIDKTVPTIHLYYITCLVIEEKSCSDSSNQHFKANSKNGSQRWRVISVFQWSNWWKLFVRIRWRVVIAILWTTRTKCCDVLFWRTSKIVSCVDINYQKLNALYQSRKFQSFFNLIIFNNKDTLLFCLVLHDKSYLSPIGLNVVMMSKRWFNFCSFIVARFVCCEL